MYTFLFASGIKNVPPETLLRSAGGITRQLMPSQGVDIVESTTLLPEIDGGWVHLAPTLEPPPHILSELVNDDHAVLVFGSVQRGKEETSAQVIDRTWRTQGVDAVRSLEGCFSAVLVDRTSKQSILVSDLMGRRTLRYFTDRESFFVSPHDLPIVATGRCPLTYNVAAARSILVWGWSLAGRSLLEPLVPCRATDTVTFCAGRIQHVTKPPLDLSDRLDARDERGCAEHLDKMVEVMRDNARQFVGDQAEVETDMTAGLDTRAVLSLLLSVTDDPSRIHAFCRGEEQNWEVQVARRLAKHYGVRFSPVVLSPVTGEVVGRFIPHCDLRAFHMNGDTDSNRAFATIPTYNPDPIPRACGRGGEIFRDKSLQTRYEGLNNPEEFSFNAAFHHLEQQRMRKFQSLPWANPELAHRSFAEQMTQTIQGFLELSANGQDLPHLIYVLERYSGWGAMAARFPWLHKYWSPFESPNLVRLAFRLPAPISNYCLLHETLVRRYMPLGYWTRINRSYRLPLVGSGRMRGLLRRADQTMLRATGAIQKRLRSPSPQMGSRRPVEVSSAAFAGPLADTVHDILHTEGGFGRTLFGNDGVQQLIDRHSRDRKRHDLQVLGFLVTMERWRVMMEEAHRMATSVTSGRE